MAITEMTIEMRRKSAKKYGMWAFPRRRDFHDINDYEMVKRGWYNELNHRRRDAKHPNYEGKFATEPAKIKIIRSPPVKLTRMDGKDNVDDV